MSIKNHPLVVASLVTVLTTTGILMTHLLAQSSPPDVPCTDSDGGADLAVKGTTVGTPWDAQWNPGVNYIYGQEPDPTVPKKTTDNFTTHYDYCSADKTQLNEGECNAEGKVGGYGHPCPYGCSDGVCKSAPSDAFPSVTLSVQATAPTTWRPGGRGYFSWSATDDKALQSVIITTSKMMYSTDTINESSKCEGRTFCEEKVYIIVPSNPGAQFVTVMATDTAGQAVTKTVHFDAPACANDADCGGGSIQWAGASYCGSEAGSGLETDIMQYGVAATCRTGGICDTSSLPRLKQKCAAGQVCTYGSNGVNLCIAQASACAAGAQITSVCTCGNSTMNYPYDWRVSSPTYCCSGSNGSVYTTSPGPCPAPSSPSPSPLLPTCPQGPPNPYASCSCGGFTYNTSSSYCCIDSTTRKEYQSPTACPAAPTVPTPSRATAAPTPLPSSATPPSPVSTSTGTPEALPPAATPGVSRTPSPSPAAAVPTVGPASPKTASVAEARREVHLLKARGKQVRTKIRSIEKNIASLEKKIDAKLRLLDRVKKAEVQKRVRAQIDGWQKKVDALEEQREQWETTLDELRESYEQLKAVTE